MSPRPTLPREVQVSFLLWLTAVAAGVVETIIRVIYSLSWSYGGGEADVTGVVIRVIVYTVVIYIIAQMRLGKTWARITLAVLLGGIGTLSLVIDPILWLAGVMHSVKSSPRRISCSTWSHRSGPFIWRRSSRRWFSCSYRQPTHISEQHNPERGGRWAE